MVRVAASTAEYWGRRAPLSRSSARPTTPPAAPRRSRPSGRCSALCPASSPSTRPTGSSRLVGARARRRPSRASWCCGPSPRPGPWPGSVSATSSRTRASSPALSNVALPYHLDALKQAAGRLALGFSDEMRARVAATVEERGRVVAALGELPLEVWPSEANFILFRVRARDASAGLEGPARALGAGPRHLGLAQARRLPPRHHRHAVGERPIPIGLSEVLSS